MSQIVEIDMVCKLPLYWLEGFAAASKGQKTEVFECDYQENKLVSASRSQRGIHVGDVKRCA
jgi:hypothetical protein